MREREQFAGVDVENRQSRQQSQREQRQQAARGQAAQRQAVARRKAVMQERDQFAGVDIEDRSSTSDRTRDVIGGWAAPESMSRREAMVAAAAEESRWDRGQEVQAARERAEDVQSGRAAPETLTRQETAALRTAKASRWERGQALQRRRERVNERIGIITGKAGIDQDRVEATTGRDIDGDGTVTTPEAYVASEVTEKFDTLERGRDFTVNKQGSTYDVEFTDRGLTAAEAELEGETGQRLTVTRGENGGVQVERDTSERFGDGQIRVAGTSVEEQLEGAASAWQGGFKTVGGGVEWVLPGDTVVENLASGAVSGVGAATNLPGFALTFKEAGETAGYLVKETAAGQGGAAVDDLADAGGAAVDAGVGYAMENPARATGMIAGSLVTGYGVTRLASRVGAGRAAAFAIDPAEEIAGTVATKALSTTSRGARVVDAFGGRVDVESTAMYGAGRAKRAATTSYDRFKASDFMQDTRAQGRLIGSGRSESIDSTPDSTVTAEDIADTSTGPGALPGNEGAGVDSGEPVAGGDPWPDHMLPEGHPLRSDTPGPTHIDDVRAQPDSTRVRAEAERQNVRVDSDLAREIERTRERFQVGAGTEQTFDRLQRQQRRTYGTPFDAGTPLENDFDVDTGTSIDIGIDTGVQQSATQPPRQYQTSSMMPESTQDGGGDPDRPGRPDGPLRRREWEYENETDAVPVEDEPAWKFDKDAWNVGIEDVTDVVFDDPPTGGGR